MLIFMMKDVDVESVMMCDDVWYELLWTIKWNRCGPIKMRAHQPGLPSGGMETKVGFYLLPFWVNLIRSDLFRFRSSSPISGGCCRCFLGIMEEDCYRSVLIPQSSPNSSRPMDTHTNSTQTRWRFSHQVIKWSVPKKNRFFTTIQLRNLPRNQNYIIKHNEYVTHPKKKHLHHGKYPSAETVETEFPSWWSVWKTEL